MGSARRFVLLLAAGVAIMVLYVRSGESLVVLVLSLITFLVGLALFVLRPWRPDGATSDEPGGHRIDDGIDHGLSSDPWDGTWRCGHDVTWDERGVRGVAVGDRLPHLTVWSRIDGIAVGRHRDQIDDHGPQQRRGLHLDLYRTPDAEPPATASGRSSAGASGRDGWNGVWLCLGPDQDPDRVAGELTSAWRQVAARRWYPEPER